MTTTKQTEEGFSDLEKAAMKERARELKAQAKGADGEADITAKIGDMPAEEQELANRFHDLVKDVVPGVGMRTWYGMPAYTKDGSVVVFFQSGAKMKTRYCTVGFSDTAQLDKGSMWPTSWALTTWNATNEKQLRSLVEQAFA